jgi:hypothetical protein
LEKPVGRWEKKVVRYASSFFGFSIRMVWVENERELEDLRERLRLRKAEVEGLINELTEQIDGYHALNRRLAVELARVERRIRGEGWTPLEAHRGEEAG